MADMIRGNHALQEGFAQVQVDASTLPTQIAAAENAVHSAYVIEALLDMALLDTSLNSFNLRIAAVHCIDVRFPTRGMDSGNQANVVFPFAVQGYAYNNTEIRLHFLDRAVQGFTSGEGK